MSQILTVDEVVKDRVLEKLKKHDATIKAEVLKEAKKKSRWVNSVTSISFKDLELPTKEVISLDFGELSIDNQETDIVVNSFSYSNDSDTTDKLNFAKTDKLEKSWHWSLTAGVTFGYTAKADLAKLLKVEKSVEISFSGTYGEAVSESASAEWSTEAGLPPRQVTILTMMAKQVAGELPFSCKLVVDGVVKCKAKVKVDFVGHQTRSFDIPLDQLLNQKERTYETTGTIVGASGTEAYIKKRTEPLPPSDTKTAGSPAVESLGSETLFPKLELEES